MNVIKKHESYCIRFEFAGLPFLLLSIFHGFDLTRKACHGQPGGKKDHVRS